MTEIAPGLHRWTVFHPDWEEEVGCLAVETDDGLILIDPLDPPPQFRKPAHVLITVFWHGRGTERIAARHVWASGRTVRSLQNRGITVTDPIRKDTAVPGGLCGVPTARVGELVYWLPKQKALAVGDVLLGAGAKPRATDEPLRLCPERWLGKATHEDLRGSLEPLLDLPVQRVLVSHGEPVLRGGKAALANVLAQMLWHEFERAAPELAALGRERIERFDCVLIGTLTQDGSPRVNPVEAYIVDGHLLMNMMPRSLKALDLLRDPRIFVHTLVTSKLGDEGEFKLRGRAVTLEDERLRGELDSVFERQIQWRPPPNSHYFDVDIERVAYVRYDDGDQHVEKWPTA